MAVGITGRYLGQKKVELTHGPSGTTITTAAPVDNQGDGSSFSPTDLTAGALAACLMTIMGIVAERHAIDLTGAHFSLEKHMTTEPPRRIARIPLVFHLPARLTGEERGRVEAATHGCPVHRSLHEAVEVVIEFHYDA